ncbi:MAG: GH39 family glycosyl hydrolase [Planctomycetota bacterium]|jgi:hypothetical protein
MARKTTKRGAGSTVEVSIDASARGEPIRLERYGLGQGGQSDEPMLETHIDALKWLRPAVIRLFVQEYYDVYPDHGTFHWETLDRAVANIVHTGAKPLMCLCIKPPVLFPEIDQDKVHPTDYSEWEDLVYEMVKRYNRDLGYGIDYWEVFNEPDLGETGGCPSRFTPEDYCTYYEHTVRAIRRAWPDARVGGPALASYTSPILRALLEHCSEKNVPIDFVSWHWYTNDPLVIRRSIEEVRALLAEFPGLKCETVINEWNMSLSWDRIDPDFQPCFILDTTYHMLEAGLDLSCYYQIRDYHVPLEKFRRFMTPKGAQFMAYWWNVMPQFHGLFDYQGTMRPSYFIFKSLSHVKGARLAVEGGGDGIKGLAAYDDEYDVIHLLLWNFSLDKPGARRVKLSVENLPEGKWRSYTRAFDAAGASNDENHRLRLVSATDVEGACYSEAFDLAPYAVTFVALKRS